ncbi:MAG: peptidylprolyl isomerase [Bacteroidota bacterium]
MNCCRAYSIIIIFSALVILLIAVRPNILLAQTLPQSKSEDILILKDKRSGNSEKLLAYLVSDNAWERESALLALANIQDSSTVDQIIPLLSDESSTVRTMAAFALGMVAKPKGTALLFRRLSVERNEECVAEIFNAIGLSGTPDDLKKLISQSEDYKPEWKPYVAQAIIRFANRKIKDVATARYTISLLEDKKSVINAAYALMRMSDTVIINTYEEKILRLLNNTSPLLRMWGATMLGASESPVALKKLIRSAQTDKDWRVRVNAIRALKLKQSAKESLMKLIEDKNMHVALAAVVSYDAMTANNPQFVDSLRIIGIVNSSTVAPAVKDDVRKIAARRMGERALQLIGGWKGKEPYATAQRIRAYGETRSLDAIPMIKEAIKHSGSSLVLIAGIEAYQSIARQGDDVVQKDFLKTATLLFGKRDAGISYTAALAFQDTSFRKEIRRIYLSALYDVYKGMNSAADLEPMVELLNIFAEIADSAALPVIEQGLAAQDLVIRTAAEKAYRAITGEQSPVRFVRNPEEYNPFFRNDDLQLLSKYSGADVITLRGKIRIVFEKNAAPLTVLNFIMLSQKKFFDGLSFHRVVGNFVIQGGDPLGNGSGGPNYSIRTEIHPSATYRTGAVGMASAGKDTEGSQWFITHCPTPHLDYRYTIFGYTSDTKVVNSIMIGDSIERVVLF